MVRSTFGFGKWMNRKQIQIEIGVPNAKDMISASLVGVIKRLN